MTWPRFLIPTDPPPRLEGLDFSGWASWFTWSEEFRGDCVRWLRSSSVAHGAPDVRELAQGERYSRTYAAPELTRNAADEMIAEYAADLFVSSPPSQVMFVTELLGDPLEGSQLRVLLALWRERLTHEACDEWAALCPPLGTTGPRSGAFPLHFDLYVSRLLFNIFDDVPCDDSGRALFCDTETLAALFEPAGVPRDCRDQLMLLLADDRRDGFDTFQKLLHGSGTPWARSLRQGLRDRARRVPLRRGDGYLLHDRRWMHGRERPSKTVSPERLHRLTFDTQSTAAVRHGGGSP